MKTVLITGASRGIGRATALLFASHGYETILTCQNSMDALEKVKNEIEETYHTPCHIYQCNAGNYDEVESLFSHISSLDVLVNNAGIAYFGLTQDMTAKDWHHVLDTNLSSVFYTCKHAIPLMLSQQNKETPNLLPLSESESSHIACGRIINVSSIWGNVGASMEVAYSATKGGINAFTKALAKELSPSRIPVNAIAFGVIDTAMNDCLTSEDKEFLRADIPAGRFGTPKEAAELIWQTANAPTYMTGQIITMAGGYE